MTRRGVLVGALAVVLGSVLPVAGNGGSPAAASSGSITLYSGQHVQTTQALIAAFEKKTGITVNARYDDEDVFVDQIETEGKNSPADVFYTENSPPLEELASKGLLSSITPSTLAHTPAKYNSPKGKWVGISARVSVLVYNTSLLKASQLPTSVMDLAQPKWKGKIALAGSETDFQPIVTSVARTYGDAAALTWLKALKANATSHLYPDNETITAEVNAGQVAGAGDHRPEPEFRVSDRLRRDPDRRDAVQPAPAQFHLHRTVGHGGRGDHAPSEGAALVIPR